VYIKVFKINFYSAALHAPGAKVWPIATDALWSVCVCLFVGQNRDRTKTAEPIEMPFWMWTRVGPRNHV